MSDLKASIIPGKSSDSGEVDIVIYVVTGRHGILKIPESFCKECNLFYQAAKQASEDVDFEVSISIRSYWTRFLYPLLKGGHHPPVMLMDGELVAQGYDVPDKEYLRDKIEEARKK